MILTRIMSRLLSNKKKEFNKICLHNGINLDFNINKDALGVFFSIFEEREYSDWFPFYKKVTIVDIGAHYGYFSIFSAINSGKGSRIIAIEPDNRNFKVLSENIRNSKIDNITAINCAISNTNGEAKLYIGESVNNSLMSDYALNKPGSPIQNVAVKTLELVMNENKIDTIDFLKMDCEGSEYSILFSAPAFVLDKINTISMEFHDMKNADNTGNVMAIFLAKHGFTIVKYEYAKTTMGLNYGKIIGTKLLKK